MKKIIIVPKCECGCGKRVTWNKRKKEWNKRLVGHHERTKEMRKQLSNSLKKSSFFHTYNKTKEHSEKVIKSNQNRIVSELTKEKISTTLTGRIQSKESNIKRSITAIDNGSHRGKNNASWKGGISPRKDIGEWTKISKEIKKRDNYTCKKCGTQKNIDVHHIDFDKHNHEPLNLISLCRKCHMKKHKENTQKEIENA